jgi:hypothetical protein
MAGAGAIRLAGAAIALALLVPAAGSASEPVRAPKTGSVYTGQHGGLELRISGRSIEFVAFGFDCGRKNGRTVLNSVPLEKTPRGYRFGIRSGANMTYPESNQPDENGSVRFRGRFSRSAKSVRGVFRVTAPHCRTGDVEWRAFRRSSS